MSSLHARPRASARRHPLLLALHVVAAAVGEAVSGAGQKETAGRAKAAVFFCAVASAAAAATSGRPAPPPSTPVPSRTQQAEAQTRVRATGGTPHPQPTPPSPSISSSSILTSYASAYFVHAGLHRSSNMRLGHSPSSAMGTGKGESWRWGEKVATIARARKNATRVCFFRSTRFLFFHPQKRVSKNREKKNMGRSLEHLHDGAHTQKQ